MPCAFAKWNIKTERKHYVRELEAHSMWNNNKNKHENSTGACKSANSVQHRQRHYYHHCHSAFTINIIESWRIFYFCCFDYRMHKKSTVFFGRNGDERKKQILVVVLNGYFTCSMQSNNPLTMPLRNITGAKWLREKNPFRWKCYCKKFHNKWIVQKVAKKATRKKMVKRAREIVQCRKFHHNCLDNIIATAQRPLNA